jgi:hypothetical protein
MCPRTVLLTICAALALLVRNPEPAGAAEVPALSVDFATLTQRQDCAGPLRAPVRAGCAIAGGCSFDDEVRPRRPHRRLMGGGLPASAPGRACPASSWPAAPAGAG